MCTAVVAVGGNALIVDNNHCTFADQYAAAVAAAAHLARLVADGWRVVVTHGNGPQVGMYVRRGELAAAELPMLPLDANVAATQGELGYTLQQALANALHHRGLAPLVVSLVTQVVVDAADPAFAAPSKPIGCFMDGATAASLSDQYGWHIVEDGGRGWRRVVPSPEPCEVVELAALRRLLDAGAVVIAAGGGGVPVVRDAAGCLRGVEAVIDKDYASSQMAIALNADVLVISTGIEQVALNWGKPDQRLLSRLSICEAQDYLAAGQFPGGSMGPKIAAAVRYVRATGRDAIITAPHLLDAALAGAAGTRITID
jgi:carbamate kinase